jgi:hypothetical protein
MTVLNRVFRFHLGVCGRRRSCRRCRQYTRDASSLVLVPLRSARLSPGPPPEGVVSGAAAGRGRGGRRGCLHDIPVAATMTPAIPNRGRRYVGMVISSRGARKIQAHHDRLPGVQHRVRQAHEGFKQRDAVPASVASTWGSCGQPYDRGQTRRSITRHAFAVTSRGWGRFRCRKSLGAGGKRSTASCPRPAWSVEDAVARVVNGPAHRDFPGSIDRRLAEEPARGTVIVD